MNIVYSKLTVFQYVNWNVQCPKWMYSTLTYSRSNYILLHINISFLQRIENRKYDFWYLRHEVKQKKLKLRVIDCRTCRIYFGWAIYLIRYCKSEPRQWTSRKYIKCSSTWAVPTQKISIVSAVVAIRHVKCFNGTCCCSPQWFFDFRCFVTHKNIIGSVWILYPFLVWLFKFTNIRGLLVNNSTWMRQSNQCFDIICVCSVHWIIFMAKLWSELLVADY